MGTIRATCPQARRHAVRTAVDAAVLRRVQRSSCAPAWQARLARRAVQRGGSATTFRSDGPERGALRGRARRHVAVVVWLQTRTPAGLATAQYLAQTVFCLLEAAWPSAALRDLPQRAQPDPHAPILYIIHIMRSDHAVGAALGTTSPSIRRRQPLRPPVGSPGRLVRRPPSPTLACREFSARSARSVLPANRAPALCSART